MPALPSGAYVVETLAEHRGFRLHAYCQLPSCRHHDWVAVDTLADRLGGDTVLAEILPRLRCSRCGHRGAKVTLHPPSHPEAAERQA